MSSSNNNGSQVLTFNYKQEGTSEGFNKLLYTLVPHGIIKGGDLSIKSGLLVNIAPMTCYFKDISNKVGIRLETTEVATVSVSSSTPYIVGDFTWTNIEDNFMEFKAVSSPSSTHIVFGKAIFESSPSTIDGFDYTYKTWSRDYYESVSANGDEIPFKVTVNTSNSHKLDVGKGKAIINGKIVKFNNTVTSADVDLNVTYARIDMLCIRDDGSLVIIKGNDSTTPTTPTIPYNYLAIAKITLPSNPTSLLNKVEYIYNNHFQSTNVDSLQHKISNTVQNTEPTDNDYLSGIINSSSSSTSTKSWIMTDVFNWIKRKLGIRISNVDADVGSTVRPIYCKANGVLTPLNNNNANVNLASESSANMYSNSPSFGVSGILPVKHGGTGTNTLSSGAILLGNGTSGITTSGAVGSPSKAIYIDSNGKPQPCNIIYSGICTTAKETEAKTLSISNFVLYTGCSIKVMFNNGNSSAQPTLNVNGTGAKAIKVVRGGTKYLLSVYDSSSTIRTVRTAYWRGNTLMSSEMWQSFTTLEFMYDGSDWIIVGNPIVEDYYSPNSGYKVYANGLIEQWGNLTLETYTYTYAIPFTQTPAISLQVYSNRTEPLNWSEAWMLNSTPTTTYFTIANTFDSNHCIGGSWRAIGY